LVAEHSLNELVERDFASAQLDAFARDYDCRPWAALKQAVLDWHLNELATVRSQAWIPGLADAPHPAVEKLLQRFYNHHMAAAIKRLSAENFELRRKLLELTAHPCENRGSPPRDRP
jgi:hypothetical protein